MKLLVLCPMEEEYKNFKKSLPSKPNHSYKVVCCGVGKASAAATTALELTRADYDLIVVIGYAAAHGFSLNDFIIPNSARYHDVHVPEGLVDELTKVYPLDGSDVVTILTGDSFVTKDNYNSIIRRFPGKKVLFDMEVAAICQIAEEYSSTPVMVLKLVSDIPSQNTSFSEFVETHKDFSQFVYYLEILD